MFLLLSPVAVWSIIHAGFHRWPFVGEGSFVWTLCLFVQIKQCFFCPHLSISKPESLVNKVHSLFQLGEICVSVPILIQSISMGSMSYFVCCVVQCVCDGYLNACVFVPYLLETVFTVHAQSLTICECLYLTVCACMCVFECVRMRSSIPWAASYNVSGGDGGNLKALCCPNQN